MARYGSVNTDEESHGKDRFRALPGLYRKRVKKRVEMDPIEVHVDPEPLLSVDQVESNTPMRKSVRPEEADDLFELGMLKKSLLFLFGYLTVGIAIVCYFNLLEESTTIVDAAYFALVCFTTLGYGDMVPSTEMGRLFVVIFVIVGVISMSIAVGIIFHRFVEAHQMKKNEIKNEIMRNSLKAFRGDDAEFPELSETKDRVGLSVSNILGVIKDSTLDHLLLLLLVSCAFAVMGYLEGWSVVKTLYYGVITSLTIGFGDVTPSSEWTRAYAIFLIPFSIGVFAEFLGSMISEIMALEARSTELTYFENIQFSSSDLDKMNTDKDDKITRIEFMRFMLVAMEKVEEDDLERVNACFDRIDEKKEGFISLDDLKSRADTYRQTVRLV